MSKYCLSFLPALLFLGIALPAGAQHNGMYADHRNNYLIPLQQHDALVGHAYVMRADQISRDSDRYVIGVYDQYLANVGERKIHVPASYVFDCAAFDGKHIYTRFIDEHRAVRYLVFDQQAALVFDTTLALRCRKAPTDEVAYYQQASLIPLEGNGIIDQVFLSGNGPAAATVRITPGGNVWVNNRVAAGNAANRILYADNSTVVEAICKYGNSGRSPELGQTSIVTLDARTGSKLGESTLAGRQGERIYPVNGTLRDGRIEVLSQFTRTGKKYSKVKYGVCIHRLNAADGKVEGSVFNEFTTTLLQDTTGLKGRQLMTNSYLYLSHAAPMANGHWVVALQQFTKLPVSVHLFRNKEVSYDMKSICFVELNEAAAVLASHTEANMTNRVKVPKAFLANPENSGVYLTTRSATDIGYFVAPDAANNEVSFVYTDVSNEGRLMVGNVLFRNGRFGVDKFSAGTVAFAGLLPARFGHTYLITFNGLTGRFDFDNIKFNN